MTKTEEETKTNNNNKENQNTLHATMVVISIDVVSVTCFENAKMFSHITTQNQLCSRE